MVVLALISFVCGCFTVLGSLISKSAGSYALLLIPSTRSMKDTQTKEQEGILLF
jgi:hypothetical protein